MTPFPDPKWRAVRGRNKVGVSAPTRYDPYSYIYIFRVDFPASHMLPRVAYRILSSSIMIWVVVSNVFYFHPYLGKITILTDIFQMGLEPPTSDDMNIWVFPKIVVPQNGWFIIQNPIKMDDLGVPPFSETPI